MTDERMRTSAPGVYAAGDVALARNAAAGRRLPVEHWGEALNHGEVAGANAAGGDAAWAHRARLLVDDRHAHAQARRVGRRLRRGAPGRPRAAAPSPSGTAPAAITVGVLAHERDEDYERGRELVEQGQPLP